MLPGSHNMTSPTHDNFTEEELQCLEAFRLASPALRELMIQTYVVFLRDIDDEKIKESCRLLLRAMRKGNPEKLGDFMMGKRQKDRLTLDKSFTVYCLGESCRVANVSKAGLGITYIGGEDWPESITLEYSLPQDEIQKEHIRCRTVWESTMLFHMVGTREIIRRRGLKFVDPGARTIDELHRHLGSLSY